jgi:hypothetical protein
VSKNQRITGEEPTMADDPTDIRDFKNRRHDEATKQLDTAIWQDLCALWTKYGSRAENLPRHTSGLRLNTGPDGIFNKLSDHLIALAQAHGVDDEEIAGDLLLLILTTTDLPEGRLRELITRASDLYEENDEEWSIKLNKIEEATKGMTEDERMKWYAEHKNDPEWEVMS